MTDQVRLSSAEFGLAIVLGLGPFLLKRSTQPSFTILSTQPRIPMETIAGSNIVAEKEYLAAITSLWWDVDGCGVPQNCDYKRVTKKIHSELSKLGHHGKVLILAYMTRLPQSTPPYADVIPGFELRSLPLEDKKLQILADLARWVATNRPPANVFLACDVSPALVENLKDKGYNVTLWPRDILAGVSGCDANYMEAYRKYKAANKARYEVSNTSVWWDLMKCGRMPADCHFGEMAKNIKLALSKVCYRGPLAIFAYGDTRVEGLRHAKVDLTNSGVRLKHSPEDLITKMVLEDLIIWIVQNPPPANIMVISSDSRLYHSLVGEEYKDYNILSAVPETGHFQVANTLWSCCDLFAGGSPIMIGGMVMEERKYQAKQCVMKSNETVQQQESDLSYSDSPVVAQSMSTDSDTASSISGPEIYHPSTPGYGFGGSSTSITTTNFPLDLGTTIGYEDDFSSKYARYLLWRHRQKSFHMENQQGLQRSQHLWGLGDTIDPFALRTRSPRQSLMSIILQQLRHEEDRTKFREQWGLGDTIEP